jgi:hypothetical protein
MPVDILPSASLIDRTIAIENSYTISRMQVLESLPGNPVGIAFRHVGGTATGERSDAVPRTAMGLMAKHFPNPNFNKIAGLRGGQEREIAPLVNWCREHGVTPRFEILPREGDEAR